MKLILCLLVLGSIGVSVQAKVKLTVYYESLCPDSRRFIINQLYPTLQLLGGVQNDYLLAEFIPYGKANTTFVEGSYHFVCQHGINECLGNIVHSCADAKLSKSDAAAYIDCMMDSFFAPSDAEECANEVGIDFAVIDACYKSWEGPTLKAANGIRTHILNPPLYYVPWIMFNDVWTEADMNDSQVNLMAVLCQKLANSTQPAQCSQFH